MQRKITGHTRARGRKNTHKNRYNVVTYILNNLRSCWSLRLRILLLVVQINQGLKSLAYCWQWKSKITTNK